MITNLNLPEQNLKFGASQFALYIVKKSIQCLFFNLKFEK